MSDEHASARGENSPDEKYDVGAEEAHFVDPEPPAGLAVPAQFTVLNPAAAKLL